MMKLQILLLMVVLIYHHADGHGQMYNPTPWQMNDCNHPDPTKCWRGIPDLPPWEGPPHCKGDCGCQGNCRTSVYFNDFFSNFTTVPSSFGEEPEPAISKDMLDEWLSEWRSKTWVASRQAYGLHPWNAPGSAPVWGNGCGVNGGNPYGCGDFLGDVFGHCCGKPSQPGDCGGYSRGKSATEHYRDGLFNHYNGAPQETTWTRGSPAEVYWKSNAYHRGGYAYRLCKVENKEYWKVTEECFQQGHLNFAGNTTWLIDFPWPYDDSRWYATDLITTTKGTTPEGSQWAKINLPREANAQDQWAFKDLVEVPETLAPGDYVLSFRWDCQESPQVWNGCANIKIV